jgi:hypothetical protein
MLRSFATCILNASLTQNYTAKVLETQLIKGKSNRLYVSKEFRENTERQIDTHTAQGFTTIVHGNPINVQLRLR